MKEDLNMFKNKSLLILLVALGNFDLYAEDTILDYSSQNYVDQQFQILNLSLKPLAIKSINDGQSVLITIPGSYGFESASDELKYEMKSIIKSLSKILNTYPETTIEIVGHTDNVGNRSYNQKLGLDRAKSVEHELISNEVSPLRISSYTRGFDVPLCENKSKTGKECNRRVEITLSLEKKLEF